MRTFQTWMAERFSRNELHRILESVDKSCITGLTYYYDTAVLYERYQDEIWETLYAAAQDRDKQTWEFITEAKHFYGVNNHRTLITILVWLAAQRNASVLLGKMTPGRDTVSCLD